MIERYSSDEMSSIWSEDNKVAKWLDVERAVIETLEKDILSILSDSGYENAYYGF